MAPMACAASSLMRATPSCKSSSTCCPPHVRAPRDACIGIVFPPLRPSTRYYLYAPMNKIPIHTHTNAPHCGGARTPSASESAASREREKGVAE